MTAISSLVGEHAGTNPPTPVRHTVDTLNSDDLDELYDDRDRLQAQLSDMTRDRNRWKWYRDDAERRVRVQRARAEAAETALVALRKEQDEYEENVVGDLNEANIGLARQAARAEAAIARVRKATANSFMAGPNAVDAVRVADVLAALNEQPEQRPRTTANNPGASSNTKDSGPMAS